MFYSLDPLYWLLVGPTILFALYAQAKVQSTFAAYRKEPNRRGYSGAMAAHKVLEVSGLHDVRIERVGGHLSDHYSPGERVLRLSPDVHDGRTIAAIAVAAHEAGHAIQHAAHYAPLAIRSASVPMASIGSWLSMPLIFLGFLLGSLGMIKIGIIAFAAIVFFQLVTLPVEFDASRRAKLVLSQIGLTVGPEEDEGVRKVLSAAAMTYVAATLTALAQLLYYVLILMSAQGRRND